MRIYVIHIFVAACAQSLMSSNLTMGLISNGTINPRSSWFLCTASNQGISLTPSILSVLTTPVISQYCDSTYDRLRFTDSAGCCGVYDACISGARDNLYNDVLLCICLILVGLGFLVAFCSYISVSLTFYLVTSSRNCICTYFRRINLIEEL